MAPDRTYGFLKNKKTKTEQKVPVGHQSKTPQKLS